MKSQAISLRLLLSLVHETASLSTGHPQKHAGLLCCACPQDCCACPQDCCACVIFGETSCQTNPSQNMPKRKNTATSSFGSPGREGHDSSAFYQTRLYA